MKTIKIGNHLRVKTKYEEVVGKVVYLGKNCMIQFDFLVVLC